MRIPSTKTQIPSNNQSPKLQMQNRWNDRKTPNNRLNIFVIVICGFGIACYLKIVIWDSGDMALNANRIHLNQ